MGRSRLRMNLTLLMLLTASNAAFSKSDKPTIGIPFSGNPGVQTVQQKQVVTGRVTDRSGEPLIGAKVSVPGTQIMTVTDADGNFSLSVPSQGSQLEVSYIGKKNLLCKAGKGRMHVVLEDDASEIGEVVVTGYGNVKRGAYSGSASVVDMTKQADIPVISMQQMMEGQVSGISIDSNSGMPGAYTSFNIRGIGSLNASNQPLVVLDGVPVSSGNMASDEMNTSGFSILSTINPSDIENITVLKDAASASLYGARGANGVILITTKKGREGKTTYSLKASFGVSDLAYRYRPTMGGDERRALVREGLINKNLDDGETVEWAEEHADEVLDRYAKKPSGGYSDWQKALFRKATQQEYDFSVNGGSERTQFAGSLNYSNQQSVAKYSGLERYSGHVNLTNKYKKWDINLNSIFSLTRQRPLPGEYYYSNPMYSLKTALNPSIPIYNDDGSYNTDIKEINNMNLVYENSINVYRSRIVRIFGAFEAGYTFIPGLRLSSLLNADYTYTKDFRYFSPLSSDGKVNNGQGDFYGNEILTWNWNTRLNWTKDFGNHHLDVLGAFEVHKWEKEYNHSEAKNYTTDKRTVLNVASQPVSTDHYTDNDAMLSGVFRANYDYLHRYYLSLSLRRDGSSRLSEDNRWATFWSASGSWRFSDEKFMDGMKKWLTDARLRASYGVNGNVPSDLYSYYGLYDVTLRYNNDPAMVESVLENDKLTWEKNYALNIGIDLQFINRINVILDFYTRKTKDLLLSRTMDPITGFGSIMDNIGSMRNTGVELEIRSTNIDRKDFTWTTAFMLSHNKNKVLKLADVDQYYSGYYIVKEGYSLGTICLREYAGVDPETGKPLYYSNVETDGVRSREKVEDPNEAVSVPLQNIYPKVSGSLQNTFRWKMLDLSFNFTYSLGGHSYDAAMWALQNDGYSLTAPMSTELRKRWQKPGDVTDVPRFVSGQEWGGWWHSSRGIHSTDHLRLKSLVLGATLPKEWARIIGLQNARIYFSGSNLFTWARYNQYDPELQGVVAFEIPPLKTWAFGLQVSF